MNADSRLSVALHVLLHMSGIDGAVTSEVLGRMMRSNPVVIRRTLAGLRDAGVVVAEKGHGGGWTLARDLRELSLADVYRAVGTTTLWRIGVRESEPKCPLESGVNEALEGALAEAEALVMKRLDGIVVAELVETARRKRAAQRKAKGDKRDMPCST